MKILWLAVLMSVSLMAKDPLAQRIGHGDWAKARISPSHGGAGSLGLQQILGAGAITDLSFMHYGPLEPKSSIGAHFHNDSEEMFLLLDHECQFTINGQTAVLPGPVGVPCQLKHEHAVYNPSDTPAQWVNFNVHMPRAQQTRPAVNNWLTQFLGDPTGTFNIDDDRVGARLEPHPTFVNTQKLVKETARPVANMNGGKGTVMYRRALGPSVFYTNWAYVDYYSVPPGASIGPHFHNGVEEVYLVISGEGAAHVDDESAPLKKGDAVPVKVKEVHSFENTGTTDMELIVYGVAIEKGKLDIEDAK